MAVSATSGESRAPRDAVAEAQVHLATGVMKGSGGVITHLLNSLVFYLTYRDAFHLQAEGHKGDGQTGLKP
ncbi:hypothetical protein RLO149_c038940 [Roseobacter litoralis Och 149]|uniref:Uncharacterized protein n=1 Tax=Roseobacter litoralis (strain ATCC 49566 / DSM 6996 / JCM 21268 / NBRC 15278 / OCh 149) TaxID=391595 RepID=F7ZDL3_ROSLO|nr:hypothetical protein RLO149_c038940 [Roseobacter litoralis Och 149]